ncbi:hypothetical protein PHYBLDRAFT_70278 [Phycomyces blakesleeanus NRRL 1555(-)]|uniref:Uncharacterized protein n=1 Tax=Phycomyces blakesleeanus (strain ATCC 8743b / DSM 1359 / FGSC 10004 / NBRC 33097 / NRRL 1555) TaxID=763407 RepID=A0A167JYH4_PHYB8|nr:hypothetical protein PHYBLDRAFT_70278 [Phycomyces blakesleeanus NRRL 1555(-)]OAD66919.1 hypothetical protein PHYBLDRAFT_70278 [Phycomyces blakesleeanus NRRL 1555(-)]|eukprot:XP_018284959.1 hypothetical protein PHYBLDRAFT_70278 [Phycomyces blakesleeanus NRRL 1555(-)]
MKFTSILAAVAIFAATAQAAPWGPGWQKAHAHDKGVSHPAPPPVHHSPPPPVHHEPEHHEPEHHEPEHHESKHHDSKQSVKDVGNEGNVSGALNNFFKGGIASDNSVKNSVSQNSGH